MGPIIPKEIIGGEWNFVIAFLIGISFGFVLEQAGFSSSRKLAGVFYGYDFVVLRVFFTAAITAMVGMIFFSYFGILDMSMVYINPTYLYAAIVGGVIMGLGFIIGGFCPGTSICGAMIGKIDAMLFIGGILIGILIFGEVYPLMEKLHYADFWGNVRVFDSLGISQGLFAFALMIIALAAFIITTMIEKKSKKVDY